MALVKKRTNTTRTIVIAIVVLILGGVGYFVIPQFINPHPQNENIISNRSRQVITNFGEDILSDPRYLNLRSYARPVDVNLNIDAGNPNPFQ